MQYNFIQVMSKTLTATLHLLYDRSIVAGKVKLAQRLIDTGETGSQHGLYPMQVASVALVYLLFCVTKWGWGFDKYLAEANKGTGLKFARWLKPYFQWVLPILIVIILLQGL